MTPPPPLDPRSRVQSLLALGAVLCALAYLIFGAHPRVDGLLLLAFLCAAGFITLEATRREP